MTTTTMQPERLLLPRREAAQVLSLSERTLWTFTKAGEIPSIRIGRSVRYSLADLRAWVASKTATPVAAGEQEGSRQ